jgi:hyperosmotically inducible periplasmic protein
MSKPHPFSTSPVVGMLVRNTAGEDIGNISDVVCEPTSGRLRFALIGLHNETALLVVPWELIRFHPDDRTALLSVSVAALQNAPRLKWIDWPRVAHPQWDRDVYAYYGCEPYWEEASKPQAIVVSEHQRHFRGPALVVAAATLALAIAVGYIISKQGWTQTANQVYAVAEAVKDTTVAVRDTSADAAITGKAKTALALSKRVSSYEINVDTTNAVVTLTGRVQTADARDLAGQIVADTTGVKSVRNLLRVDPSLRPEEERERLSGRVNDLERQIALSNAFQDAPEFDGAKVKVRVIDGTVILDGTVTSDSQRARAEDLARSFPGVHQLVNKLR